MSHLHLSVSNNPLRLHSWSKTQAKGTNKLTTPINTWSHKRVTNSWKQVQPYSRLHYVDCIAHLHLFLESYDNVQNSLGCCRYQLSVIIVIFQGSSSRSQITKSINITFKIYIGNIFRNPYMFLEFGFMFIIEFALLLASLFRVFPLRSFQIYRRELSC